VGKGTARLLPAELQRRLERTFCASLLKHSIARVSHNETVNVQIFGVKNSQATRAAERFFKERRVQIQLVNLKQKPMAPGEINRFIQRFGLNELIDREGKAFADAGLKYLRVSDSELLAKIENDPLLLRLPLIRAGNLLSIGQNEEAWKAMLVKP
jgi:arsenate reductase